VYFVKREAKVNQAVRFMKQLTVPAHLITATMNPTDLERFNQDWFLGTLDISRHRVTVPQHHHVYVGIPGYANDITTVAPNLRALYEAIRALSPVDGCVLMHLDDVKGLKALAASLYPGKEPIKVFHAEMARTDKEETYQGWQQKGGLLLTTSALLNGVDCKNLQAVVFIAHGQSAKAEYTLAQGAGRLRTSPNSLNLIVYAAVRTKAEDNWPSEHACLRHQLSVRLDGEELARTCYDDESYRMCSHCDDEDFVYTTLRSYFRTPDQLPPSHTVLRLRGGHASSSSSSSPSSSQWSSSSSQPHSSLGSSLASASTQRGPVVTPRSGTLPMQPVTRHHPYAHPPTRRILNTSASTAPHSRPSREERSLAHIHDVALRRQLNFNDLLFRILPTIERACGWCLAVDLTIRYHPAQPGGCELHGLPPGERWLATKAVLPSNGTFHWSCGLPQTLSGNKKSALAYEWPFTAHKGYGTACAHQYQVYNVAQGLFENVDLRQAVAEGTWHRVSDDPLYRLRFDDYERYITALEVCDESVIAYGWPPFVALRVFQWFLERFSHKLVSEDGSE
jgi:hypothetical protein